jgi:hypothetical protein
VKDGGAENAVYDHAGETLSSAWNIGHKVGIQHTAAGIMVEKTEEPEPVQEDAGHNEGACKKRESLRQRAMKAGSYLHNVGQGVGYLLHH